MSRPVTHAKTEVEILDHLPGLRITREFEASPAAVFRAHTDPEIFAQWIGPSRLTTNITDWDCRTGGSWGWESADHGGTVYTFFGSFHEVRANELIVQTFAYTDAPDSASLERLRLEDLGGGRTRLVVHSTYETFEARDAMAADGMESGVSEGYERLDDILAGQTYR